MDFRAKVMLVLAVLVVVFIATTITYRTKYSSAKQDYANISERYAGLESENTALKEEAAQWKDYGGIKLKLPVDNVAEAFVIAAASDDHKDIATTSGGNYIIAPTYVSGEAIKDIPANRFVLQYITNYGKLPDGKYSTFIVFPETGEMKTPSQLRAEREALLEIDKLVTK